MTKVVKAYSINWVSVHAFDARGGIRHSDNVLSDIGQIKVNVVLLEAASFTGDQFTNRVHL